MLPIIIPIQKITTGNVLLKFIYVKLICTPMRLLSGFYPVFLAKIVKEPLLLSNDNLYGFEIEK